MLSKDRHDRDLSSIGRLSIGAAGFLLLLGCSDIGSGPGQSAENSTEGSSVSIKEKLSRSNPLDKILDRAIQVGDGQYMIPKGIDEDGCEMFGPYSTSGPTATAIHYRQADGSFDIARDPAVCKVDMVAIGTDPSGCEIYRAKPVNSDLSTTDVIYYRDADDRYVVHKAGPDCSSDSSEGITRRSS